MRTVHWLFVVSVALFVSGIGFVIAAGRTAQQAQQAGPAQSTLTPIASVRQIMNAITGPAALVVFKSVGAIITFEGTKEMLPASDLEWEAVGDSAAALVESGNLLMMGNRAMDQGDWVKISQEMIDAAKVALKAIDAKDPEALLESGEAINNSCDNCHIKYQR